MGVESKSPPGDHSDLPVDSFDESIGESCSDVGENADPVFTDRSSGLDKGLELRSRRPSQPFAEFYLCPPGLAIVEGLSQRLLEEVRPGTGAGS